MILIIRPYFYLIEKTEDKTVILDALITKRQSFLINQIIGYLSWHTVQVENITKTVLNSQILCQLELEDT